ncbi:hypothetical protein B0H13DRAFT_1622782 [Mycena leptocephala]|nr:hypothetical protein B0H13DRAFT_1622782 [Mycena leptocephala]
MVNQVSVDLEAGIPRTNKSSEGLHILYRAAAGDATHDSEARFPQPRCHPETRKKMLDVLWNWTSGIEPPTVLIFEDYENVHASNSSSSNTNSSPIVWLHGPAGAGKSAIAQSLCQNLEQEGRLGASFFFKRGHPSRGHAKQLIATIAYQLALHLPNFNRHISKSVESDPSLVDKSLSIQLQKLIVEPCQQSTSAQPLVVVIDGLDECEDKSIQQEILHSIGHTVNHNYLGLQFLVASRPEPHIHEVFTSSLNKLHCALNVNQSFEDVWKYLLDEFARIHREHRATMAMVPEPWPSPEIINDLVHNSSGYFIYASTIIKFIDDKKFRPTERLAVIMGMTEPRFGVPFAALDQLYTQVLAQVPDQPQLLKILKVITTDLSDDPLSVTSIEQLLRLEPGDVQLALHGLHSVINLQNHCYISTHHASFCDFLQDPARAGIFYIGGCQHHTDLSCHILKAFSDKYDDTFLNRGGYVAW